MKAIGMVIYEGKNIHSCNFEIPSDSEELESELIHRGLHAVFTDTGQRFDLINRKFAKYDKKRIKHFL